ncbi:hypothetical protein BDV39DRAFT_92580 [Aspergillus sergii]|uniref:Uncharacterized protein n=1 Tax=Aspergillus sergii TaxID=1034303 RepID=A0A5N6XJ73_9EURO|nr:hypothetical protein BDV39DRAFT_92580 [Aspergillus sergii]
MWKVEVVCQLIPDSGTGLLLYPSGPLSTRRVIFLDPFRMVASFIENKKVFQRGTRLMCGEIGASALQRSTRNNPFCLTSEYRQKKAEVTCELKAMDLLTDTERRLTVERLLKYQGTAKIDLNQISLQPLISREIDQKNVERLRDIFAKDGCQRLDIRNHVTAVISRQHLERACRAAGLTPEELKTCQPQYPRLLFRRHQVQCLHGQHKLKAAEEPYLPQTGGGRWTYIWMT